MEPGFITCIPDGSKRGANITTLFLWNQCWPLSLASNIQVSECLGLGLRLPKASSKLRAPAPLPNHSTAELCLQQADSTSALSRAAAMFLACRLLLKGMKSHLEMCWLVLLLVTWSMEWDTPWVYLLCCGNQKESLTKAGSVLPEHWFREFFHF